MMLPHEEPGAVVVKAVLRSFPPVSPFCLRFDYPLFKLAPDLSPDAMQELTSKGGAKKQGGTGRVSSGSGWTVDQFIKVAFADNGEKTKEQIMGLMSAQGVAKKPAEDLLRISIAEKRISYRSPDYHAPKLYKAI